MRYFLVGFAIHFGSRWGWGTASGKGARSRQLRLPRRRLALVVVATASVALLTIWLLAHPPVNVAITVDHFSWFNTVNLTGTPVLALGAHVHALNRSPRTVWYLEDPRYYLFQLIDGQWSESWTGTQIVGGPEKHLRSALNGMQSAEIVLPISPNATAIKVGIPFTSGRFARRVHWVFSPTVRVARRGREYVPEAVARTAEDERIEAYFDK